MGLMKAISDTASAFLGDLWEDYIYCDSLDNDILMQKGKKRKAPLDTNQSNENVITQGSKIAVSAGQLLLVVENGKVIDFTAEPGGYEYISNTEPAMFCGDLGDSLKTAFDTLKGRVTFGGQPTNDQRVYYVNTKEILDNRFGFGNVAYRDSEFDLSIYLQGFGVYTFQVTDPIAFFENIAGNVADTYRKELLEQQMKGEIANAIMLALGELASLNIRFDQIVQYSEKVVELMREHLTESWSVARGISLKSITFSRIVPDEESVDKIRSMQEAKAYSGNKAMLGARVGAAQANAMEAAAENASGAMAGFAGMNMAQNATNIDVASLMQEESKATDKADAESWTCSCGMVNHTLFCPKCGNKKQEKKHCPSCGKEISSEFDGFKFCPYCGKEL